MDFAERIRHFRINTFRESQQAFAARVGMSIDWVKSVESRRVGKPTPQRLAEIARAIGVTNADIRSWPASTVTTPQRKITIPAQLWADLEVLAHAKRVTVQQLAVDALRLAFGTSTTSTAAAPPRRQHRLVVRSGK